MTEGLVVVRLFMVFIVAAVTMDLPPVKLWKMASKADMVFSLVSDEASGLWE